MVDHKPVDGVTVVWPLGVRDTIINLLICINYWSILKWLRSCWWAGHRINISPVIVSFCFWCSLAECMSDSGVCVLPSLSLPLTGVVYRLGCMDLSGELAMPVQCRIVESIEVQSTVFEHSVFYSIERNKIKSTTRIQPKAEQSLNSITTVLICVQWFFLYQYRMQVVHLIK